MRNLILTLTSVLAPTMCLSDVYVKAAWHNAERYHHGNLQPAYDLVQEWWFGRDRVTWARQSFANLEGYLIHPALRITLDRSEKRIIYSCHGGFLNPDAKYWVEIPLDAARDAYLSRDVLDRLSKYELQGVVKRLAVGEQGKDATYEATETVTLENRRILDLRQTIRATTDVDFDWRLASELRAWVRAFFHPQETFVEQQRTIEGFIRESTSARGDPGRETTTVYRILEMSSREPPLGVYGLPEGFEKRTQLAFRDLDYLLQAIHGLSW